jgi:hypothetical protein
MAQQKDNKQMREFRIRWILLSVLATLFLWLPFIFITENGMAYATEFPALVEINETTLHSRSAQWSLWEVRAPSRWKPPGASRYRISGMSTATTTKDGLSHQFNPKPVYLRTCHLGE